MDFSSSHRLWVGAQSNYAGNLWNIVGYSFSVDAYAASMDMALGSDSCARGFSRGVSFG